MLYFNFFGDEGNGGWLGVGDDGNGGAGLDGADLDGGGLVGSNPDWFGPGSTAIEVSVFVDEEVGDNELAVTGVSFLTFKIQTLTTNRI